MNRSDRYDDDYRTGRGSSQSPEPTQQRGRSATPPALRGQVPMSRAMQPPRSQFDDDDDGEDELTPEEQKEYDDLLAHFGGDENALAEAIEAFMEEFERNGGELLEEPSQQQRGAASRSPSPGRR